MNPSERPQESPQGPSAGAASSDARAVLATNAAFYAAFNARDPDAMATLWASQAEVTCVHPGWTVLRGREAVLDSWRGILGNPQQAKIIGAVERVQVLGPHRPGAVAIIVGRELVGGNPIAVTNVFLREADAWKLLHHHASPVMRA